MTSIHLVVLIHGMWGNPGHLAELARIIRELHSKPAEDGSRLHVLIAETNAEDSTYDGIDWGGERVAREVYEEVAKLEADKDRVDKFSVTGYSLGGLVARYVSGILYQNGFFQNVTPVNFNTIATPHLGLPRFRSFISSLASSLGPKLLSRTGEQFYCVDKFSQGRPLLDIMSDPDQIFYKALQLFRTRRIYANSVNDITVPFVTAAIEVYDPFIDAPTKGLDIEMDPDHIHVIKSFTQPSVPPPPPPKPRALSKKWLRQSLQRRPFLPPALQFRFPWNIVLYASLPILFPLTLTLVLFWLSRASKSSKERIKSLENGTEHSQSLLKMLTSLEHSVENAVVDIMENDPNPIGEDDGLSKEQPILTALQKKIARNLNGLQIEKELAHFPDVRNSHAMIVCRDIKRFPVHLEGQGVVRHWAESFIR